MCVSNPQNANFDGLTFDGDQSLIIVQQIYAKKYDIIEILNNGPVKAALFYADNGMLVSSDPQWLQWAFTQLVGLFDRVGLNMNTGKTPA